MTRRELLHSALVGTFGLLGVLGSSHVQEHEPSAAYSLSGAEPGLQDQFSHFEGADVLSRIINKAKLENWRTLAIGEVMGKVAMELRDTPYVGFTLEISKDLEYCVVDLKGLDCVTFFENTLDIARMIKKGESSPDDLLAHTRYTRYRLGQMRDYTSRLHYTTDWIVDNDEKGVVKNITPDLPGAEDFTQKVGIMSHHPEHYRQLVAHPELLQDIRICEDNINARSLKYLPMDKLKAAEPLLKTGDIVGVTTTEEGIDIAHTGLCIRDDFDGSIHFMDASSMRQIRRVHVEDEISKALTWSTSLTGVMIARPLEPR